MTCFSPACQLASRQLTARITHDPQTQRLAVAVAAAPPTAVFLLLLAPTAALLASTGGAASPPATGRIPRGAGGDPVASSSTSRHGGERRAHEPRARAGRRRDPGHLPRPTVSQISLPSSLFGRNAVFPSKKLVSISSCC
jgi:hypothetical protein